MPPKGSILLAFVFFCQSLIAQEYPFIQYTPKDGLVNSRVRKVYQDSKGRLYFLTFGGLSVYDGARFKNYTKETGLAVDMVNDILEIGNDSLLVATNSARLNILVGGQMKFFTTADNFYPIVNQFLKSEDGNTYVTADQGLYILHRNKFEKLDFPMLVHENWAPFLGTITEWKDFLLFTTNDLRRSVGLYVYDKKTRKLRDVITDLGISCLTKDRSGKVWVGFADRIHCLDIEYLKKGKLRFVPPTYPYAQLSTIPCGSINFDDTHAWITHGLKEIIQVSENGAPHRISILTRYPNANIMTMFIDRENIAWIGTEGAGLIKLAGTGFRVQQNLFKKNSADIIYNVTYVSDTTWYFLNHNIIRKINSDYTYFKSNVTTSIYSADQVNGKLIISDEKNIYETHFPPAGQNRIDFKKIYSSPKSLASRKIIDSFGSVILYAEYEIIVLHNNRIIFKYPLSESDMVEGMKAIPGNKLWVLTRYAGILIFNIKPEDPVNYLQLVSAFKKEFQNSSPRCAVFDKNGIMWVGTRYNGVFAFRFTGRELQKWLHFDMQKGLSDNFVTAISCDSSNNILVGTQTGLDRLVVSENNEYRIENVTKRNNVFGFIKNLWVERNGEAYALQTTGAILEISPVDKLPGRYKPQLFIEEISVNGKPIQYGGKIIRLSYKEQNLNFNVAAPTFIDEKQVKYSYRLSGNGNNSWSEPSSNASINLLNLAPGEYTFEVRALFPSTSYPSKQISYSFIITPPWWQTWWFRIMLVISGIVVIAWLLRSYYQGKLKKQKIIFEKQKAIEHERTRIAMEMHDDLGSGLTTIRYLAGGLTLDASSVTMDKATKIASSAKELVDSMNDIIWTMKSDNSSLEEMLAYIRKQAAEQLENNSIDYSFDFPKVIPDIKLSSEQKRNLVMISKEAVHNIIKHAKASHVKLRACAEDRLLQLSFADDGRGINVTDTREFGNGLKNMRRRAEEIGAIMNIQNSQGTTITINVKI